MTSLMYEEAFSAAHAVAEQLRRDADRCHALGALLRRAPPARIVTIARGSSDHAATYFNYLLAIRTGRLVNSLPLSLMTVYDAPIETHATDPVLALAISQSGMSPDVRTPVERYRRAGATTVALVNDAASPLADAAEWVLPMHAGPERSVAATKSFICSLVACARLVAGWSGDATFERAIAALPTALEEARDQDWRAAIDVLAPADRIMVVGRGTGLSIAQEAALKFKETCAIQAEAFSGAEIKHGPMALVDDGYPLLIFAPRGPAQTGLLALAAEMRARGARVLLAAPADTPGRDLTLAISGTPDLDPIVAIQSFYMLIERLSRERGCDPDRPRHLNKVTSTV